MITQKALIICGILSSLLYVGMNIFVPMLFEGYDSVSQTVSELSAIDAPTRALWVPLAMVYILLFAAFGFGIWKSADGSRHLRIVGVLVLVYAIINFYWPPMHLRGNEPTLTDTLHIVWSMMAIVLMMLIMGFAAKALERSFRIYTIITFIVFIVFGVLTGLEAPGIGENLPTPRIGIWERVNIGAFMLWVIVFAVVLLRRQNAYSMKYEHHQATRIS